MKKIIFRLMLGLAILYITPTIVVAADMLIPVGRVVGLELHNNTVTVADLDDGSAAQSAGIQIGDRIVSIDDHTICTAEDVRMALDHSQGSIRLTLQRDGQLSSVRVEPTITPDGPKLGVYLRQGVTGIGTITYYDPATQTFAALGHGVNEPSGQLLQLSSGHIYDARVASVRKGKPGEPGQLIGSLCAKDPLGRLNCNTPQGVFGKAQLPWKTQALPIGEAENVKTGNAIILSTVSGDTPREYSVEILKLYPASRQNGRNMLIRVTDPDLLDITGGIVQGMSGSPLVQDGKLIGAVTHVLVNDPTMGYGIFIENMLEAAG